jgi:hypothetical protein
LGSDGSLELDDVKIQEVPDDSDNEKEVKLDIPVVLLTLLL